MRRCPVRARRRCKALTIAGVNPDAFGAFIAKADAIGRDIDAAKTAGFAPEIAADGSFPAGDADIAFTVAGGVLRAPPVKLENPAATLTADITADLKAQLDRRQRADHLSARRRSAGRLGAVRAFQRRRAVRRPRSGDFDSEPLAQFLTQRALERSRRGSRRCRRRCLKNSGCGARCATTRRCKPSATGAAEELRRQQEAARLKAEAEARAKAEAEAKAQAEAEAKAKARGAGEGRSRGKPRREAEAKAEEEVKAEADAEAKAKADAEARARAAQQAADEAAKAEEQRRRKAEEARRTAEARRIAAEQKASARRRAQAPRLSRRENRAGASAAGQCRPGASQNPRQNPALEPSSIDNLLKSLGGG